MEPHGSLINRHCLTKGEGNALNGGGELITIKADRDVNGEQIFCILLLEEDYYLPILLIQLNKIKATHCVNVKFSISGY
ncbi:hypothetical protein EE393_03250 [Salmonella enterica]|uniref:Uncharacterized protein n=2 Tax=Salmonella enterica TaxID=28901 RepID=A0A7Z1PL91_SALET|nr:hypothetical protein [Salmonella enterica subsp. diarizonae]EAA8665214.1 hypothetical protein [Salmonella enterica]PTU38100.1 hypothetical protein DBZ43_03875 [Salmonella enterica subsp. enterica]EAA9926940.1 hypothetical protein [Salmonella enterica]EAB9737420.1 hypothetical protein [Salmonella enterica subsp. diarizonae]